MAEVDSTLEVTKYLQTSLPYVDKDRTAIWGWSYGGYLSLSTLISDKQNIFKMSKLKSIQITMSNLYYFEGEKSISNIKVFSSIIVNKDNSNLIGIKHVIVIISPMYFLWVRYTLLVKVKLCATF